MAEIVWSEPALADLDAIADFIALDNPAAAADLVRNVFGHIEQLRDHPESGSRPPELKGWRYRQVVEPPCRVFYRHEAGTVFIVHARAAKAAGTTSHNFIIEAIAEKAGQAEQRAAFHALADQRYADFLASGESIPWEDARAYLQDRLAGKSARRPAAKRAGR